MLRTLGVRNRVGRHLTRTLREGKTLQDYRDAWFHSKGFGVPTQMYTIVRAVNPREVVSIGIIDCDPEGLTEVMTAITAASQRRDTLRAKRGR